MVKLNLLGFFIFMLLKKFLLCKRVEVNCGLIFLIFLMICFIKVIIVFVIFVVFGFLGFIWFIWFSLLNIWRSFVLWREFVCLKNFWVFIMLFGLMIFEGKVNCDLFFCEKCNVFFEDGKICCWNFLNIVLFRGVFILKKR